MGKTRFPQPALRTCTFDPRTAMVVVVAEPGTGKTTFARDWGRCFGPKVETVFIATRDSHKELTCLEPWYPKTFEEVAEAVDTFLALPPDRYPVLSIDDFDSMLKMAENDVCEEAGTDTIRTAKGGFGAGERAAEDLITDVILKIKAAGRALIGTTHARTVEWADPRQGPVKRIEPTLSGRSGRAILAEAAGLWLLAHPFVERKEMNKVANPGGRPKLELKNARKYVADWFRGEDRDILAELEPADRILLLAPTAFHIAKTRTDGRAFPQFLPLPAPPDNTAAPVFEFWERAGAGGSGRPAKTRSRRSRTQ